MNYSQLIEKYLKGELAGDELKRFLEELQKDHELAQDVETLRSFQKTISKYHKKLIKSSEPEKEKYHRAKSKIEQEIENIIEKYYSRPFDIPVTGEEEFKETVKRVIKDKGKTSSGKKRLFRRFLSIAACLIVISSILVIVCLSKSKRDISKLYSTFYRPLNIDYQTRDIKNIDDLFNLGIVEFVNGNYAVAIEVFNNIPDTSDFYPSVCLLKGISYMEIEDFNNAVNEFEEIKGDKILHDTVNWYLGLCYLKLEKFDQAKLLFTDIARNESYYSKSARTVLKRLK